MGLPVRGELSPEQLQAINMLRDGLAFHDHFGPQSDDCSIMVEGDDTNYELAQLKNDNVLRLGHLRTILSIFMEK